jgi:hypothetical protein
MKITRRKILGSLAASAAGALSILKLGAGRAHADQETKTMTSTKPNWKNYPNERFYDAEGKFDVAKAKEAYYEMMRHYHYPIPPRLRGEDFWALDFGLGKFTEVGMAGIFWINNKEHGFFGHEIYLLPGQMIPEHQHLATEAAKAKMEGWHVRNGWVYVYGEGVPTPGVAERIPATHKECAVARTEQILKVGETATLGKPGEKHWMRAGPDGAIVSEYATYHDGAGLRFSHPKVAF